MIAAQLNYGLGYFGFHRLISIMGGDRWLKAAEARYSQYGILILVPSFIHPNLGGFMSVAAGTAHLSYGKFVAICLPSVVGWNVFWGVVTYFAGGVAESVVVSPYAIIMAFSIWIVISFMWECVKQV
jgi:membrane protein DedA with SNARE-associated domain